MAEEFNIIIEHLRALRADVKTVKETTRRIEEEMRADRMVTSGLLARSNGHDEDIAHLKLQMERVNDRLSLVDTETH